MNTRGMFLKTILAATLSLSAVRALPAQSIQLHSAPIHLQAPAPFDRLLPNHVKANPMGFSPLCRLELDIERKLPLGVWFKMESPQAFRTPASQANLAYFRFKVPLSR